MAVIFGGQSSEHEVSCISAANVIAAIDRERYDLVLIGITKKGRWIRVPDVEAIRDGSWYELREGAVISPDATEKSIIIRDGDSWTRVNVDIVFPVLHGLYGEDGTIQGLCTLAQIPFVGDGVLASAVGMDKLYTKIVVDHLGSVRQAAFELVVRGELDDPEPVLDRIEERFDYPVFIKPCNAGSSCGVSRAADRKSLRDGLHEAARYDRKILVEEAIVGHEVECAVLGGGDSPIISSGVGEILAAADFYDYEAKYYNPDSKTVIDPTLPGSAAERVPGIARQIFRALDGYGLARVDFFVTEKGEIIFNEINTMPGFTSISMYPMLFEAAGISKKDLVQRLIDLAGQRSFL